MENVMQPTPITLIPNYFDSLESTIVCQSPTVEVLTAASTIPIPHCDTPELPGTRRGRGRPHKRDSSSTCVTRRGRGRPRKAEVDPVTQDPSFDDRMKYQEKYEEALHAHYSQLNASGPPVKRHRATYSANDAIRVLNYMEETKASIRDTARKFNIPKSTIQDIKKRGMPASASAVRGKHKPGAGRPISYGVELDKQLLEWVLDCQKQHLLVTVKAIKAKALELIKPSHPGFKASDSWLHHFLHRHSSAINSRGPHFIGLQKSSTSLTDKMIQIGASSGAGLGFD